MEFSQKLYKLDSKQKVRILHIYTEGSILIQESGLVDGAKVKHEKICTGKNIGKSNQTTPEEQAILQVKSKTEEKLSEGYFFTIEEAKSIKITMPMLALSYNDEKSKIKWANPVYISPKMDGMRCHIVVENGNIKLMSRAGKEIVTMKHIHDAIKPIISPASNFILDGELYYHGSFQENMRLIKKVRPGETEKVCFVMYDIVSIKQYIDRFNFAKLIVDKCKSDVIKLVETIQISSEADLILHHKDWLSKGFEGSMLRHGDTEYQSNKRSTSLLKYKDFQDTVLAITDITSNDAQTNHGTPWFELNGIKFKAGCKLSHIEREDLLINKDKYIGMQARLRYFETSEDGVPRFPVFVGFLEH